MNGPLFSVVVPTYNEAESIRPYVHALRAVSTEIELLVVDDNETNRCILEEMLTNWGMVPTTAPDVPAGRCRG